MVFQNRLVHLVHCLRWCQIRVCDINGYETTGHRIEGQISGKMARVSTFWLSHPSVVPYMLLILRFVFETVYGPTWIANTFACCMACWHDQSECMGHAVIFFLLPRKIAVQLRLREDLDMSFHSISIQSNQDHTRISQL